MFNFNGMPYKGSGRAGGKSVSTIGMLVLLLAALMLLPSCTGDGDTIVEGPDCGEGTELNEAGDACVSTDPTLTCGEGTMPNAAGDMCVVDPTDEYYTADKSTAEMRFSDGDDPGKVMGNPDSPNDFIDGEGGDDSIKGLDGNDDITGGSGDDKLYGGEGNDKLDGGTGDDTLDGGPGNDELTGGSGNNTLDGGEGVDIAIYLGAMQVTADLDSGRAVVQHAAPQTGTGYLSFQTADSGTGHDSLTNIENVKGTHGKDRLDGDENANLLKGLDEADIINGNDGDDTILPNRPAMANATTGVLEANVADTTADPPEVDGVDVVDGGDGSDTISYEGESATVTVALGTIVPAVADDPGTTGTDESVIAHVAATIGSVVDMIKVVPNEATEEEDDLVSTIENVTGGFGDDALTGDARSNTLIGGAGADTLTGGAGDDIIDGGADDDTTLDGGDGDDTYMAFVADETITEAATDGAGMMDTVHYATLTDDADTAGTDESVVTDTTPDNVEIVVGTPNVDNLTAADTGVTILGLGGNDVLVGGSGIDTLVGCGGMDTLTGGGGNDNFGIFNDSDDPDTITDFATGADDAAADEIHLKGFDGTPTPRLIPGNSTQAGIYVGADLVAIVGSTADFRRAANPGATPPVTALNQAQGILAALGKNNSMGHPIVRTVPFDSAKCM